MNDVFPSLDEIVQLPDGTRLRFGDCTHEQVVMLADAAAARAAAAQADLRQFAHRMATLHGIDVDQVLRLPDGTRVAWRNMTEEQCERLLNATLAEMERTEAGIASLRQQLPHDEP
jgi:hypothetical protein